MNTSRGEGSFSLSNGNGLRLYAPHLPINFATPSDPLPQVTQTYLIQTPTPDPPPRTPNAVGEEGVDPRRRRGRPSLINSVSNLQSSCPSPDEIVIKGRGRRSLPLKWSPIPTQSPQKVPMKSPITKACKKGLIALRSSPRKRLQLNDSSSSDLMHSRKSLLSSSPLARKSLEPERESPKPNSREVDELSKDQLVKVLNSIIDKHPQIKDEIGTMLTTEKSDDQRENTTGTTNENPIL